MDSASCASFVYATYIFIDALMSASKIIEELGGSAQEVLAEHSGVDRLLQTSSETEKMRTLLTTVFEKVIAFRDSAAGSKYHEIIAKAQTYIRENYSDKDISLHLVAREVNLSPNHFSTIFSQETGETFISYVTRLRLERAKHLLKSTKIRTSDISYEVGYNDTQYFSCVFKKNIGMTPKDFRNS